MVAKKRSEAGPDDDVRYLLTWPERMQSEAEAEAAERSLSLADWLRLLIQRELDRSKRARVRQGGRP